MGKAAVMLFTAYSGSARPMAMGTYVKSATAEGAKRNAFGSPASLTLNLMMPEPTPFVPMGRVSSKCGLSAESYTRTEKLLALSNLGVSATNIT